jgi:hypothetical protein
MQAGMTVAPPIGQPPAHAAGAANGAGGVFAGWNAATGNQIALVKNGHHLGNRDNLPPHRYLVFPPGAPAAALSAQMIADKFGWIKDLERPGGMGLVNLAVAAGPAAPAGAASPQAIWNAGGSSYKYDALLAAQMLTGPVSVAIYYKGGSRCVEAICAAPYRPGRRAHADPLDYPDVGRTPFNCCRSMACCGMPVAIAAFTISLSLSTAATDRPFGTRTAM